MNLARRELAEAIDAVVCLDDAEPLDPREGEDEKLPHHGRVFHDQT